MPGKDFRKRGPNLLLRKPQKKQQLEYPSPQPSKIRTFRPLPPSTSSKQVFLLSSPL
jgi:hypothetical protein